MIVVAIVAILTTIAYPNYRDYVIRGQLVEGTTALASLRANMERYYQDNRTYITSAAFPSPCATAPITATVDQDNTEKTVVTTPPAPATFLSCNTAWVTKTGGC